MKKRKITILIILIVIVGLLGGYFIWSQNRAEKLTEMRETAIEELHSMININDYRTEQQEEIQNIFDEYETKINESKDQDSIDAYLNRAKEKLDEIKTDEELKEEEVASQASQKKKEETPEGDKEVKDGISQGREGEVTTETNPKAQKETAKQYIGVDINELIKVIGKPKSKTIRKDPETGGYTGIYKFNGFTVMTFADSINGPNIVDRVR